MKKRILGIILVITMVLGLLQPLFALSVVPTVVPTAAPNATQQKVINAFWQYTGDTHPMIIELLENYFAIQDPNSKVQFLVVYQDVLTALGGYGDKIEAFGLTAQILEKLNTKMSLGKPNTYQAFINGDYANFEAGIVGNWSTLVNDYTEARLVKLADGLNKVFPVAKKYVVLKDDPMVKPSLKMLGYSQGNNSVTSLIEYNIRAVIGKANLLFGLSSSYSTLQPALLKMQNFYNGLTVSDKSLVYSVLTNQGFLYKRIQLSGLTTAMTTLSGTTESGQMLRATVNGQPLTASGVNSNANGIFTFSGFSQLAANTVVVVEAYAENGGNPQVLDTATVTVSAVSVVPPTTTAPVIPPTTTTPISTIAIPPTTQTGEEIDLEDPDTPAGALTFNDIINLDWAREAINAMVANGIFKGKTKDTFAPKDALTRAEFSVVLTRLLKLTLAQSQSNFKDVKGTDWFAREIQTVFVNNLIKGLTKDTFNPKGKVTRQEMSVIIGRILTVNKIFVSDNNILKQFADLKEIAIWAVFDTKLTVQEGIIKGRPVVDSKKKITNIFAPKAYVTRAEAAVMLYRLSGKVPTAVTVAASK